MRIGGSRGIVRNRRVKEWKVFKREKNVPQVITIGKQLDGLDNVVGEWGI